MFDQGETTERTASEVAGATPTKPSMVFQVLGSQENALMDLVSAVERFHKKLQPIMSPKPAKDGNNDELKQTSEDKGFVVSYVRENTKLIKMVTQVILKMHNEVDL